jgi:hypothetical protein
LDIANKLNNYFKIRDIINNMFRPKKYLKKTRMKHYNTLDLPALLYSSNNWTIKTRDTRRITAAELKCMRKTTGYTWRDYKPNTEIAKQLNTTPVLVRIQKTLFAKYIQNVP